MIKSILKGAVYLVLRNLNSTRLGRFCHNYLLDTAMSKEVNISHEGLDLTFVAPNALNEYRVQSFSTKEPETLEWIESFEEGATFWDVGANVGLYSCYAAKLKRCNVVAFEPSVFNLELLARNIFANELVESISIFSLPLNNENSLNTIKMSSTRWGGALSTFAHEFGQDGEEILDVFRYRTYGVKMDEVVNFFGFAPPKYLKIDVDGIEHFILQGGTEVLASIDSALVEINDAFKPQAEGSAQALSEAGLSLVGKWHSQQLVGTQMEKASNQIWKRK